MELSVVKQAIFGLSGNLSVSSYRRDRAITVIERLLDVASLLKQIFPLVETYQ
jgi:hypothetical protein